MTRNVLQEENDMGRKSRLKRERRKLREQNIIPSWTDEEGMHTIIPSQPGVSAEEMQEKMTIAYQKEIKASPVWDQIVEKYGEEKAEEFLKECKARIE